MPIPPQPSADNPDPRPPSPGDDPPDLDADDLALLDAINDRIAGDEHKKSGPEAAEE